MSDSNEYSYSIPAKLLITYASVVAFALYSFWFYQLCGLGMQNITSNEDIRHRWNGHYRNKKMARLFKKEAGCCGRMKYLLCGDYEAHHGKSKLELYSEVVECSNTIKQL